MIPKSVSVSTRILALGAGLRQLLILSVLVVISSWPVCGWAGEPDWSMKMPKAWDGGGVTLRYTWRPSTNNEMVEYVEVPVKLYECEQRMREAMKLAERYDVSLGSRMWAFRMMSTAGEADIRVRSGVRTCDDLCAAEKEVERLKQKKREREEHVKAQAIGDTVMKECVQGRKTP